MAATLLILSLATFMSIALAKCYPRCRFYICSQRDRFWMPTSDMTFTGEICDKKAPNGWILAHVNSGEALVRRDGRLIPISQWAPNGLNQKFSKHFFKTAPLKMMEFKEMPDGEMKDEWHSLPMSGIQHEVLQGHQGDYVRGKCFVLPFNNWQYTDDKKAVQTNVNNGADPMKDCVAFETRI